MSAFTADDLLSCYRAGVFPMGEARDDARVFLVEPEHRGVIPLERFHVPRRLARTIRAIDRIQAARVHLVLPERPLFSRETPEPSASIVVRVRGALEPQQIKAIRHLVSSAVNGLKPQRVSIVDESGQLLADGATVTVAGISANVLHTPGHTPGSICLHLPAERLLLAGDTLFAGTVGRTDLPYGDTATLIQSIRERLLPLPDETRVIPGHGEVTSIGIEMRRNPFLQA